MMHKHLLFLLVFFGWALACDRPAAPGPCPCAERVMKISSTTSVDNTGLLRDLLPAFEARSGIGVQVLAVGTGQALKLASQGDVDAVFVHDRVAEDAFLAAGDGIHRLQVMHNDFVIVGPAADPAGARGKDAALALQRIAATRSRFVSRGDQSGTHKAELRLWQAAAIAPAGDWYLESGQGQRMNLTVADEKQAYCTIDRATFLTAEDKVALKILVEGDAKLHNPYSFIPVNPAKHPHAKFTEAMALAGWLTGPEGQKRIADFRAGGKALFIPDALPAR